MTQTTFKENEMDEQKYWAYKHINGSIKVKSFWPNSKGNDPAIEDAYDSDFVSRVLDPYPAKDRAEAEAIAVKRLA